MQPLLTGPATTDARVQLDFSQLVANAPWPVKLTLFVLIAASLAVWLIGIMTRPSRSPCQAR